jgi:MFS family permease
VNVWWIWGLALGLGFVQLVDRPSAQVFLSEMVEPDLVPQAVAMNSVIQSTGRLAGPAVAGLVYAAFGPAWCFGINAASYGIVVIALLAMRTADLLPRVRAATGNARRQIADGLRYVRGHKDLRDILVANAVIGCLAFNFLVLFTSLVKFTFHQDAKVVGTAAAIDAAGSVIGGIVMGAVLRPGRRAMIVACFLFGGALAVNALAPSVVVFLVWAPCFGFVLATYQVTVQSTIQTTAEPAMLGRVVSLTQWGTMGTTPIGSILVGVVIDVWSPRAALGLASASALVCGLLLAITSVKPGDTTAEAPAPAAATH